MVAYPDTLWSKPLPPNIMSHTVPSPVSWKVRSSWIESRASSDDWNAFPRYYAGAADPIYRLDTASSTSLSCVSFDGSFVRIPSGACLSQSQDHGMLVWDQTTNKTLGLYWFDSPGQYCLPPCSGTTESTACPLAWLRNCGVSDYTLGPAYADGVTVWGWGADSLGNPPWSLHLRHRELIDGIVQHPLVATTGCTTGHVFPAFGNTFQCSDLGAPPGPPNGALVFLDYSDAEIEAMNLPAWQEPLVRAAARYGIYISDTNGSTHLDINIRTEGYGAYERAGITSPINAWLEAQGLTQDIRGRYAIPFLDLPGVGAHLHMAHECVALGLAQKPGGCL